VYEQVAKTPTTISDNPGCTVDYGTRSVEHIIINFISCVIKHCRGINVFVLKIWYERFSGGEVNITRKEDSSIYFFNSQKTRRHVTG
jgi:hypothetical protein